MSAKCLSMLACIVLTVSSQADLETYAGVHASDAPLASSGGKATSVNYSGGATVGNIVGVSTGTSAGVTLKSDFIGRLDEAGSWRRRFHLPSGMNPFYFPATQAMPNPAGGSFPETTL
jgi:hypothetical protein